MSEDIYSELTSYDGDSGGSNVSIRVYDGSTYYITLRLSDMVGAELTEMETADGMKRGIFIPYKEGGLTVTPKRNVLAVFKASLAQVASPKYTHLLSQIVDKDTEAMRKGMGFIQTYVGFMRKAEHKINKYNEKKTRKIKI